LIIILVYRLDVNFVIMMGNFRFDMLPHYRFSVILKYYVP